MTQSPAPTNSTTFRNRVLLIVSLIPKGKVATYGQVALLAGVPRAARAVGDILHWSSYTVKLPYQRIINRNGGLAKGYSPGGTLSHKADLEADGVVVSYDFMVDLDTYLWHPSEETLQKLAVTDDIRLELAAKFPLTKT